MIDKTTQYIAGTALLILGPYSLVYGAFIPVPFRVSLVVFGFWFELALIVILIIRVRRLPLIVVPTVVAVLGVLVPSARTALSWTAWLISGFSP
jgi:hypothetical protein